MVSWRKVFASSLSDQLFIGEAAALLIFVWLGLRIVPFGVLRRVLNRYAGQGLLSHLRRAPSLTCLDPSATGVIDRIAWAVRIVADRYPGRMMTCLVRALAVDAILKRHGRASELCLGVRTFAPFEAHAWVECEGCVVIGQLENLADYAALSEPARS